MTKKDLSDIIALMRFCGQWNGNSSTFSIKLAHHVRQVFMMVACVLSLLAMYVAGFVNSLGNVMFFSMIGTFTSLQSLILFSNHATAIHIIKGFQDILKKHQNTWENETFHKETDMIWKIIKFYMISCAGFIILYLVVPIVTDTYLIYSNPNSNGYRVPLPLQGFLDPHPVRNLKYYLTTLTGTAWAVVAITASVGIQSLLCLLSTYLSAELKILCTKLRIFGKEENAKYFVKPHDEIDNKISERKLKELIINHQEIMSIAHEMAEYFGFPFALQNTMTSMCICLLLYAVLMDKRQDTAVMLTNIFVLFIMFGLPAVTCGLGQRIENQSLKVFEALYDLPWYKQDPELRKYINMMMRQAARHLKIHYKGGSPLNLRTLMQILNTSYSYFMVLKSTV